MVVKGAEVDIARVEGGVDKTVLKRLLSNKGILDHIQKRISKTICESDIQNGFISGPRRGEISARNELENRLKTIESLFSQIDKNYSAGERKILSEKKQRLIRNRNNQIRGKNKNPNKIDIR